MPITIAIKRSNILTLILTGCGCLLAIGVDVDLAAIARMNARITEIRKQIGKISKFSAVSLAENTKMNARNTEMSKQKGKIRK
ncbi:hypothetical protein MiSe_47770 [Microseira wollei NIES-4236]|uniref:Uncharacterized protein n=1 Tax=Microseira wollei NIES-4236 TaxID=2530354 RepID=A0AAV3XHP0_9CYAN|nr:hypothetical protein MiSe_47770 [Microseira wollei NIES-4236]